MSRIETEALTAALVMASLLGLIWLAAAAWIAVDEQRMRAESTQNSVAVAAWQISQVLENVRQITEEAAARPARGELP